MLVIRWWAIIPSHVQRQQVTSPIILRSFLRNDNPNIPTPLISLSGKCSIWNIIKSFLVDFKRQRCRWMSEWLMAGWLLNAAPGTIASHWPTNLSLDYLLNCGTNNHHLLHIDCWLEAVLPHSLKQMHGMHHTAHILGTRNAGPGEH